MSLSSVHLLPQADVRSPQGALSPLVLLAEDNENEAFLFHRALKKIPFTGTLHHVEAGDLAIQWLNALAPDQRPSLAILDLKMPRVDGFEVLQWLRSEPRFRDLPTVIFSSSDLPADRSRAEQLGASGYYLKPLAFPDYERIINSIFSRWGGLPAPATASGL